MYLVHAEFMLGVRNGWLWARGLESSSAHQVRRWAWGREAPLILVFSAWMRTLTPQCSACPWSSDLAFLETLCDHGLLTVYILNILISHSHPHNSV